MHTSSETASLFNQFFKEKVIFPDSPASLYEPCEYLLHSGGKRIRPVVCLMAQELFSDLTEDCFHAAAALELFHNFTLIHDDIMDKAPLRRGTPTVPAKYGQTTAILSGDVMNIYAYRQLEYLSADNLFKILPVFNKMGIEICEGQQLDTESELSDDVELRKYMMMIELKTAVLLASSMKIGAILGGANEQQAAALYDFGKNIGIAFQLQDDYLDAFGLPEETGKQPGGDILANKKTFPYIHYHSIVNDIQSGNLDKLFLQKNNESVQEIIQIWRDAAVDKEMNQQVATYTQSAFEKIKSLDIDPAKSENLVNLFKQLMNRKT